MLGISCSDTVNINRFVQIKEATNSLSFVETLQSVIQKLLNEILWEGRFVLAKLSCTDKQKRATTAETQFDLTLTGM